MIPNLPLFVKTFPWVLALLLGVICIGGAVWRLSKGWNSLNWPYVQARILEVSLDDGTKHLDENAAYKFMSQAAQFLSKFIPSSTETTRAANKDSTNSENKEEKSYQTYIRYAYTINGHDYSGSRISFSYVPIPSDVRDKRIVEKLSATKTVRVYYNPENPADSVIIKGLNASIFGFMLFGIIALGCSRVFWILLNTPIVDYSNFIQGS